eukprot:CAMPEP_0117636662 /NCGR_PEP_ID=MMETSP0802-20121206/6901_1 /TAXON_ID=38833 /ORGANISM="Micromonas sp., Strain CCMP2099" /LENGTH=74 /DNA_ID=CAMNT_0005441519 /DNA_START=250 /DNA_END=474 /DNA_ORIENTATION=+
MMTSESTTASLTLASAIFSTTIRSSGTTLNCCAPTFTTPKIVAGGGAVYSASALNNRVCQIGAGDDRGERRDHA